MNLWTWEQACAWAVWRDDAYVARVGPGGGTDRVLTDDEIRASAQVEGQTGPTTVQRLLDDRRQRRRHVLLFDHPSSSPHRGPQSEVEKPVVGSVREFRLAVQSGRLLQNEDGYFDEARVRKVFPPVGEASAHVSRAKRAWYEPHLIRFLKPRLGTYAELPGRSIWAGFVEWHAKNKIAGHLPTDRRAAIRLAERIRDQLIAREKGSRGIARV